MSILPAVYKLTRSIQCTDLRQRLHQLIHGLMGSTSTGQFQQDRSMFGYLGRKRRRQFLGFLEVDNLRSQEEARALPFTIPPLEDEERSLLHLAHRHLLALNQACLVGLDSMVAELANPYAITSELSPLAPSEFQLFSQQEVSTVVEGFRQHPAYQVLERLSKDVIRSVPAVQIQQAVLQFTHRIRQAGVDHVPSDFEVLHFPVRNSPQYVITQLLIAVMCLRESIFNLDQLVYQAVVNDQLNALTEDNIVNLRTISHLIGNGYIVECQPTGKELISDVGELILLKASIGGNHDINQLCCIEKKHTQISMETGTIITFGLRGIDEYLNPFRELLRPYFV